MDEDKKKEQETDWVDQLLRDVAREAEEPAHSRGKDRPKKEKERD